MNMFRKAKVTITTSIVSLMPALAHAHNPQVQIGIEHNQIVTHGLFAAEPYQNSTPAQRVYEIPMGLRSLSDANDGWYADYNHATYPYSGPGVALLDGNFAAGSVLKVNYLDGLKIWNGSSFVDPGEEQVAASTSSTFSPSILTMDVGPFNNITLSAVTAAADEHKTLRWRLLGEGLSPNTVSDDGIYLISLQLSTNQAGINASLPYYFLLNKNGVASDASAALDYVNANLVPEPATAGLMAVAGFFLFARRRRTT